jgi:hypothetical protein
MNITHTVFRLMFIALLMTGSVVSFAQQPAQLIVTAEIINDHEGTGSLSEWTINVHAENASTNSFVATAGVGTSITLDPGPYTLSTTGGPEKYSVIMGDACHGEIEAGVTVSCKVSIEDAGPPVGHVIRTSGRRPYMKRHDAVLGDKPLKISDEDDKPAVWLGDKFIAPSGDYIALELPNVDTIIDMTGAVLTLSGTRTQPICEVSKGDFHFNGRSTEEVEEQGIEHGCCVKTASTMICPDGTDFYVQANGWEADIFVVEGNVSVQSNNPAFPEGRIVRPIPAPRSYRLPDARSGSSDCIYSNCKLTDRIPILSPPFPPPEPLIAPPFNPPGDR